MAIYHFSVKTISRSSGRSATAAIAYRAGEKIECQRLGITHDYTRKTGIEYTHIYLPEDAPSQYQDRSTLWNQVEQRETRKNSTVAREFEIAFPQELNAEQRIQLLNELCHDIIQRHHVAVDACIHAPHKDHGSDERNYHAHILMSTRELTAEGFTHKTRSLDQKHSGEIQYWREHFATLSNHHLRMAGSEARVDHRSYAEQNIPLEATLHEGPMVTKLRRQGIATEISLNNDAIKIRNQQRLQHHQTLDLNIAETEIQLKQLKSKSQTREHHPHQTPPNVEISSQTGEQEKTLSKLYKGEISAKQAHLTQEYSQSQLKKLEEQRQTPEKHYDAYLEYRAKHLHQQNLKQQHAQLTQMHQEREQHRANKPLMFGQKKWQEKQRILDQRFENKYQIYKQDQTRDPNDLKHNIQFMNESNQQYHKNYPEEAQHRNQLNQQYRILKDYIRVQQQAELQLKNLSIRKAPKM